MQATFTLSQHLDCSEADIKYSMFVVSSNPEVDSSFIELVGSTVSWQNADERLPSTQVYITVVASVDLEFLELTVSDQTSFTLSCRSFCDSDLL